MNARREPETTMTEQALPAAESRVSRSQLYAMLGIMLVLFLVSLDQTVVGTAMPRIIAELNGFELYAWVTTIYLLVETATLPIVGKLGDLYGRKWFVIGGIAVFMAASALCGIAQDMTQLILFRGLQGIGAGMILATVFTMVADVFPDMRDRARYQGLLFSVFAFSSVLGPILGGWITDALGWRWLFYVNVPIGILAFVVLPAVLPAGKRRTNVSIDYAGAVTIVVAVVALLLSMELIGLGFAWNSLVVLGSFALSIVAFALFIPIERRAVEPIIPLSLFRNRVIVAASIVLFFQGMAMFGASLYLPLFIQGVLGFSPSASGMAMVPLVITMTVIGTIIGRLVARYEVIRPFQLFGTITLSASVFLLTTLTAASPIWLVSVYLFVMGLGMGSLMPVNTLAVQSSVEVHNLGVATSATQFIRSIGSTVGIAAIGTFVTSRYASLMMASIPAGTPEEAVTLLHSPNALINESTATALENVLAGAQGAVQGTGVTAASLLDTAQATLASALHGGFLLLFLAALMTVVGALIMPAIRLGGPRIKVEEHRPEGQDGEAALPVAAVGK